MNTMISLNRPRNRIKAPSFVIALGLSSPCIRIFQRKKTIRRSSTGKKTLMESSYSCVPASSFVFLNLSTGTVDWFFICRHCRAACYVRPGSEVKLSGHLRILSREHLSDSRRSERHCTTHLHPFRCRHSTPILSSDVCRLGEFPLVFELRDQSYLWSVGNNVTAMVAPICQDHPTTTV